MSAVQGVAARVGWCPGVLRPMRAGDGLLVRVKPRGHRLSLAQAAAIAALAELHGNGALTLTGRGNLQMRGLRDDGLPSVTAALADLGLLDPTPEGEAVRNVVSPPLAGTGLQDLGAEAEALEEALATDPRLWRLPAKFAWVIDDGGSPSLAGIEGDVRVVAVPERGALAVEVGGLRGLCRRDALVAVAGRLAAGFLTLCLRHALVPHRMADLVAVCGAEAVLAEAGLSPFGLAPRSGTAGTAPVGVRQCGTASALGLAPAFGLLRADALATLAGLAARAGAADLRLTPWRSLLVPLAGVRQGDALAATLADAPFILDPADPRLAVAACVGAPACHRGTTPVPDDAARFAAALPPRGTPGGIRLHVSGCAKGCAHPAAAPLTLVGEAGRYGLVRGGRASDPPQATGLSGEALVAMLRAPGEGV